MPDQLLPGIPSFNRRQVLPVITMMLLPSALFAQTAPTPDAAPSSPALPPSADASNGEQRDLSERPSIKLSMKTSWADGLTSLGSAIQKLSAELARLSLRQAGNPVSHFLESDDIGFSYDLHLPVEAAPPAGQAFEDGVSFVPIPGGRAAIFTHEGAYDDIDAAYEAIAAWLDERGLTSTGRFLEEYLTLPAQGDDPGMKLKISIFLK